MTRRYPWGPSDVATLAAKAVHERNYKVLPLRENFPWESPFFATDYEYGFNADGSFFSRKKEDRNMDEKINVEMNGYRMSGKVTRVDMTRNMLGPDSATVTLEEVLSTPTPAKPAPKLVHRLMHEVSWGSQVVLKARELAEAVRLHGRLARCAAALLRQGAHAPVVSIKTFVAYETK